MAGTGNSSIRSYNYYASGSLTGAGATGTYGENQFDFVDVDDQTPFLSHSIIISNEGGGIISYRFTPDPGGGAAHGTVLVNETLQLDFKRARRIYLSGTVAGSDFRLWAW